MLDKMNNFRTSAESSKGEKRQPQNNDDGLAFVQEGNEDEEEEGAREKGDINPAAYPHTKTKNVITATHQATLQEIVLSFLRRNWGKSMPSLDIISLKQTWSRRTTSTWTHVLRTIT